MARLSPRDRLLDARERVKKVLGGQRHDDAWKIATFHRFLAELDSRGIDVVLVRYPAMPAYNEAMKRLGVTAHTLSIAQPHVQDGVPLLNHSRSFDDRPHLFADADHLNEPGKALFTVALRRELENLGYLR